MSNKMIDLPPFAEKVISKLRRFEECASDFEADGVDIGRHWLDLLTQLGLLNRTQRSPALWEITQQGEDLLRGQHQDEPVAGPKRMIYAQAEELSDHPMTYMNAYDAGLEAGLAARHQGDPVAWRQIGPTGETGSWWDGAPTPEDIENVRAEAETIELAYGPLTDEGNKPAAPAVERQDVQVAAMPVERCYDVRVKMIIAFNEARKNGGDLDDGLDAAYKSALRFSPNPLLAEQPAPVSVDLITAAPDCIKPELRPAWVDGWNSARTAQLNSSPVAVVLPEYRDPEGDGGASYYIPVGWNACLDKVKELNQ